MLLTKIEKHGIFEGIYPPIFDKEDNLSNHSSCFSYLYDEMHTFPQRIVLQTYFENILTNFEKKKQN